MKNKLKASPDLSIVAVTPENLSVLREISISTFTQTFASHNSESDMQQYISDSLNEVQLLSELTSTHSKFYFAYVKNELAGYLKLNFPLSSLASEQAQLLEIERIYVLHNFQGKAIGYHLLEYSKNIARHRNLKGIWLGVWEYNEKALQFYKKHNFVQTGSHIFKLGEDEQTDIIMELRF